MTKPPPVNAPVLVRFERAELQSTERSLTREWIETDGVGGFASSTVLMCNLRRYHGLLVAPFGTQAKRFVFVSHMEETLRPVGGAGGEIALSMARFRDRFNPLGHRHLESFELRPWPQSTYVVGSLGLRREIQMLRGSSTAVLRYTLIGQGPEVDLRLRPFFPCREADALTFENDVLDPRVRREGEGLVCQPYAALPAISIGAQGAQLGFEEHPLWLRGLEYSIDLQRGYDGHEDNFSPGWLHLRLRPGMCIALALSIQGLVTDPLSRFKEQAARRSQDLQRLLEAQADPKLAKRLAQLELGADDFLYDARVERSPDAATPDRGAGVEHAETRRGVIAGYPWFLEWGRDTFLALPGLTLARGRIEEFRRALLGARDYLRGGLLPNIFAPKPHESAYNSADAALWFARACLLYDRASNTAGPFDSELHAALSSIAEHYLAGTELGLFVNDKGLLHAGSEQINATWMDAVTSHGPVTPRNGYAVELNALWYSLLAHLEELEKRAGNAERSRLWRRHKRLTGASFLRHFWVENGRYLADVVHAAPASPTPTSEAGPRGNVQRDERVRPNMILAAALEFSPLSDTRRRDVVRRVEFDLLTARGLRTLSPRHSEYRGVYGGTPEQRDLAYHQGTVWPWLLGSYVEASLRAFGLLGPRRRSLMRLLEGFDENLIGQGLNHVSEVFDGDPPHRPGGSFAQAWNTAELLRAWRMLLPAGRGAST